MKSRKVAPRSAGRAAGRPAAAAKRKRAPARPARAAAAARPAAPRRAAPARPAPAAPPPVAPDLGALPTPPPAGPAEARPREAEPNFFEPDDLPSAAKPVGAGPFYQNDRRDRPIYDTEAAEEQAGEDESAEADLGDEEDELDEEEDDEDEPRVPPATGPPAGRRDTPGTAPCPELKVGAPAPRFACRDQGGREHALADYRGRYVVLYFYPKDDTPGCTREACGFRDRLGEFESRGTAVLGISPDSVASHAAFARKFRLPFPLLADQGRAVAQRYGAWGDKPAPGGGKRPGILRTTFVIDPAGRIAQVFRQVRPEAHEAAVLDCLDRCRAAAGRP